MTDSYRLRQQKRETDGTTITPQGPVTADPPTRLVSLDAYRGFIMLTLAATGFGIAKFALLPENAPVWQEQNRETWQAVALQFGHPVWESKFGLMGVRFWDLIQPAFMFMVGVAMPFSYARREAFGHSAARRFAHAAWRGLVLVLLGVFLASTGSDQTNWTFTNVLAQIGLGYVFAYALLGRKEWVQWSALAAILIGSWYFFWQYTPAAENRAETLQALAEQEMGYEGKFAPWSKNANAAHAFDVRFLNLLRDPPAEELQQAGATTGAGDWAPPLLREWLFANPQPFVSNGGGYQTLNFVPSIATTLLGILCGQFLMRRKKPWRTVGLLVAGGAASMVAGLLAHQFACPIVKRIWTPSWVLFSGAYVIWMLAAFYAVFDVLPLKKLAFPLVVVGMNSIAIYLMGQLMKGWTAGKIVHIHLSGVLTTLFGAEALADDMYGLLINPTATFLVFWLILFWMYRQKFFIRV